MVTATDIKNYRGPLNREAQAMLGEFLDNMGWTLTYADDPEDGTKMVVLDWGQVFGLVVDLLPGEYVEVGELLNEEVWED